MNNSQYLRTVCAPSAATTGRAQAAGTPFRVPCVQGGYVQTDRGNGGQWYEMKQAWRRASGCGQSEGKHQVKGSFLASLNHNAQNQATNNFPWESKGWPGALFLLSCTCPHYSRFKGGLGMSVSHKSESQQSPKSFHLSTTEAFFSLGAPQHFVQCTSTTLPVERCGLEQVCGLVGRTLED